MESVLHHMIERVRDAAARQAPLRIRGGGSKDFHGGVPLQGEELDTRAYSGVVSYEPSELVVTARAGTPLAEVETLLAEQGQCLAFEPPHFGPGATVGGMVAAGLSGPARASVGAVRDFVLGVQLINGRAEHLTFGGQVMKNVAGYDVSRLMVGAWGTLGLLTQVSLKVLPLAPAEATLRFACDQTEALRRLHAWGGKPLPLNASCWTPATDANAGHANPVGQLDVRLRGAVAAVEAACKTMGGERLDNATMPAHWNACREQRSAWFAARVPPLDVWRLSVPDTAPVLALPEDVAAPLVEWHGALRWVQAPRAHAAALYEKALLAGGSASLFIAGNADSLTAQGCFAVHSAALGAIHQRLRQAFDPAGIFNPARAGAVGA